MYVTKVIILPIPPKVPINRRNYVSLISIHFSKVSINRRNCVSPISRYFSKMHINRRNCVSPISRCVLI